MIKYYIYQRDIGLNVYDNKFDKKTITLGCCASVSMENLNRTFEDCFLMLQIRLLLQGAGEEQTHIYFRKNHLPVESL